ncbi:DUF3027 domain-containing protein [Corynebacterium sp. 13CS0277]|uniref:DUF3027 domain-containing protein n=1 Tax=Corynebacterium sp. 13CS0277 TaxID=2071994 RepID=UPI000D02CB35|nr:DUF3027 domain-containing protein [Corynebacterium sp. 13CS0277]PRQ10995.1 DUF3027 domain-containing protein [Corynebacterium sp. 13CS0277]
MPRRNGPFFSPAALDVARSALEDVGQVGRHLGTQAHGRDAATLRFEAHEPGYAGWEWHVVLACAPGSDHVTVNEVALMPGQEALKAPEWVPYEERLRKGDLTPEMLLPPRADDPHLEDVGGQMLLSPRGWKDARERWRSGKFGPQSVFARHAAHPCGTCGFYIELEGKLDEFGICANEIAADGHVVHERNGCGAHTLTPAKEKATTIQPFDDEQF